MLIYCRCSICLLQYSRPIMALVTSENCSSAAVFTGIFLITYFAWNRWSRYKSNGGIKLPPSVGSLPLVGSLPFLPHRSEMPKFFLEKAYKGSDVMSFGTGKKLMVVLSSYEAIREALVKQALESADRPRSFLNDYAFNPKYKGIASAHYNSEFKKIHQLSLTILKEFGFGQRVIEERIILEVEDLVKNLRELKCEPVYPKQLVSSSVLSVISSIVLGDRLKDAKRNQCVGHAAEDMTITSIGLFPTVLFNSLIHLPKFKKILQKVLTAQQYLLDMAETSIQDCETKSANGITPPESFISNFMQSQGKEFDREQLKYITRDLLLAGFETTSTTLLWALLHLANNPKIQKRMQDEIDSVVPRERFPSLDDRVKLVYVEAFILEVMRRNTLVPFSVARAALKEVTVGEFTIPQGNMILPNLYAVHMNKDTWGDPENFRPERFLDDSGIISAKRERVIPFSIGKRSCLDELLARQEIYLFITGLLQSFHISPPNGVLYIEEKELLGFVVAPVPFNIRFIPRD